MSNRKTIPSSPGHRRWWLWTPLLAASAWLAFQEPPLPVSEPIVEAVSNVPKREKDAGRREAAKDSLIPILKRDAWFTNQSEPAPPPAVDLFGLRSWTPPPPPPSTTHVAAPPPMAPPLPFTLVGKKLESGAWEVYLSRGDNTYIVREGTRFADHYRVERISPPQMTLTYLPLEQSQTLSVGDAQ